MTFLDFPDARIAYDSHGDKRPAIIFVHGSFCNRSDFDAQARGLSDRFTVIAVDQRCHGESSGEYADFSIDQSARDIEDLIETLELGDVVVAGHSLGSRVALQIAADRPDRTLGVVLLDGGRRADRTDKPAALADEQFKGFLRDTFAALHSDLDAKGRAKMLAEIDHTPAPELVSYGQAIEHWDINEYDTAIDRIGPTVPVLALQATYVDATTPMRHVRSDETSTPYLDDLAGRIANFRSVLVRDAGHFIMDEAEAVVNDSIAEFVTKVAIRSAGAER
ncbi:alpha/beta hydrolase [Streptomyces iakyrus]|uniref:alpha/beta fold hydrolase n=1 Tax=Streptomyces iakyrus TaxID=68219 RepID=UPI00068E1798|nr:alpha/beta hydrolase [Streptomyces iakyrus]